LTLSKQPDGRIRWDATSVEAFGAGKRMGYLEIIPNTVRPRLIAHGFIQGEKLSFISFENQQQALANIPPEYKAAFANMFLTPSDSSQLAQTSTPPQKSADVQSQLQITPQMVTKVQQALAFLGFYKGDIDGKAGPATQGAVKQWLLKNQITGPAEITPELTNRLVANAKAEKAQRKALAIAKAKKQAEEEKQRKAEATLIAAEKKQQEQEEKQRQLKLAQAEAEKQKQAELAALENTKTSTTELPPLEPMDKVFVGQQPTNIRTEPKVLAARAGRVISGDTLTILAKVSGWDWYLVETDNGERGYVFAKALASTSAQQNPAAETAKSPAVPKIDFGKYYALVIGNNTYRALPDLHSAVNDARAVAALLESDYGFEVELLTDAARSETYSTLARMRRKVSAKDNLLIYYAGHGWLDKEADEGYWMPVDAEEEDAGNWISSGDIIAAVRRSKAKHVMVVADSCFSGTLTRGLTIKSRTPDYLERMAKKRARTALTSGGLEPVMDSGGGNHSVFAQAFLSVLKENNSVLDGHQLFTVVRKKVMVGSEQTPEYGDLRKAGHDGGDFLFVKR